MNESRTAQIISVLVYYSIKEDKLLYVVNSENRIDRTIILDYETCEDAVKRIIKTNHDITVTETPSLVGVISDPPKLDIIYLTIINKVEKTNLIVDVDKLCEEDKKIIKLIKDGN